MPELRKERYFTLKSQNKLYQNLNQQCDYGTYFLYLLKHFSILSEIIYFITVILLFNNQKNEEKY